MLHKRPCKHCVGQFQPVRKGHIFCSETCRKLSFKAKDRASIRAKRDRTKVEKLKQLANSAFGSYLVKELRRAGTVEVLQGHDSKSLEALVSLRRRCTASGGYEKGESLSYYELSHIYPVSGKERVGLLNTFNLVITPRTFNRKHSKKLPISGYLGSSIARTSLLDEWKVHSSAEALEILKIARRYIGKEFDIWLKKHLISQTQKQAILKKFKEAGFDYAVLKNMRIKQLTALADEQQIPYFAMDKNAIDLEDIASTEIKRLNINPLISEVLIKFEGLDDTFRPAEYEFKGDKKELDLFKEFVCNQAILCMHGQPYENKWRGNPFDAYLLKVKKKKKTSTNLFDDDYLL